MKSKDESNSKVLPGEFIMLHYISTKKFSALKFFDALYGITVYDALKNLIDLNYVYNGTKGFVEENFNKLKNIGELAEKEIQEIFNNYEYNLTLIGKKVLNNQDSIKRSAIL